MQLNTLQAETVAALHEFLLDPAAEYFLLTGKAGTGKTTVVSMFLEELAKHSKFLEKTGLPPTLHEVCVTAPTNKATAVIRESLEFLDLDYLEVDTKTTYSMLCLKVQKDYKTGKPYLVQTAMPFIPQKIVVIDECSMIDDALLEYIKKNLTRHKVIFLGDYKQLPPISTSTPNAIKNLTLPKYHKNLTVVERQPKIECASTGTVIDHPIHTLSLNFRKSVTSKVMAAFDDFPGYIEVINGTRFKELVTEYFINAPENEENKILAWRNTTVEEYNNYITLQKYATPNPLKGQKYIVSTGCKAFATEEVITITEDFDSSTIDSLTGTAKVVIGSSTYSFIHDRGTYTTYCKKLAKDAKARKNWADFYGFTESVVDIRKPYAQTVHKSQGSTYKNVFVEYNDIVACRDKDVVLNMLYVAVSRPTDKLFIYMSNYK